MEDLNTANYDACEEEEELKYNASRQFVNTVFRGMGKAGDSFLSGMAVAMRETGKHARVTRLKMKLPKLQHHLQKLHLTLGRIVYEQIKQDAEDILEQEAIVDVVGQIRECEERIAQVKVRVAEVKEAARAEVQEAVENGDLDLEALFDLVRNGSDEQRYSAVSNVAQLDVEGTIPILVGALGDKNPRVRLCAIRGLYKLNTEESMSFLLDAFSDDHPDIRSAAVTYLGWEGNATFSDSIAGLLEDDDDQVRRSAAIALGNLASEEDMLGDALSNRIEPLMNALSDEDVGVRQQTVIALRRITHQFFGFRASGTETERAQAIDRWASWWADHQEAVIEEKPIIEEPDISDDISDEEAVSDQEEPGKSEPVDDECGGLRLIRDRAIELGIDTPAIEGTTVEAEAEESEEEVQEQEAPAEEAQLDEVPVEAEAEESEEEMQEKEAPVEEAQLDEVPVEVETEESEEETQEEEIPVETEAEQEQYDDDTVTAFMNERCEFIPGARVERKTLYAAYMDYCESRGLDATNRIECYGQIREYSDIDEESEGREYYFTGVQLREE